MLSPKNGTYTDLLMGCIHPSQFFFKPVQQPINAQQKLLTAMQESSKKDIERFFGVLQDRFHILNSYFYE